jgi:hypothetical protein
MSVHIRRRLVGAAIALLASAPIHAAIITQYTAPGGTFAPTTTAMFTTASELTDIGSAADLQPGVTFANSVFLQQNVLSTTPDQGVSNNQFFQFTAAPKAGVTLNLTNLTFDVTRGGASTPRGWAVRSSLDGFGSTIATADIPTQNPNLSPFNVNLSASTFQNVASAVTFRVYGYAPSTGVGAFYDNVTLAGSVNAPILLSYEAAGSSFLPSSIAPNMLAGPLNESGSAADLQPGVGMPDTVFLQQNVLATTPAQAVANAQFFQFAFAPEAGFQMDLLGLHLDAARGGSSTPRGWALRSSLDGFASDIATSDVNSQNPNLTNFDIDLPATFQDIASQVTFRLYGYAPSTGVGMFYDNILVLGSTELIPAAAVPEPSTYALMLAGLGVVGVVARRRRKVQTAR